MCPQQGFNSSTQPKFAFSQLPIGNLNCWTSSSYYNCAAYFSLTAFYYLSSALLTGKNRQTSQFVNNQMNCFVSFQLTPRRGELMKSIKKAKATTRSLRYGADQSGRITVRVDKRCQFQEVKSEADLARIISNPILRTNFRQHRG